jgi:hypothetical protein
MRKLAFAVVMFLVANRAVAQVRTEDKWIGTWMLNKEKSGKGAPESSINTIEAIPGGIKVISQSVNSRGATTRTEYAAKYDGQDVPVSGAAADATAAVTRIDSNTYEVVMKSQGATTLARHVISADGKTRTVTQTLTIGNIEAKMVLVYERQ